MNTLISTSKKGLFVILLVVATLAMLAFAWFGVDESNINVVGGVSLLVALAFAMLAVKIRCCE